MQIEAVFPERLAMVRHVDHRRIQRFGMGAQLVDHLGENMIGIEQGIVIGIPDSFRRAGIKVCRAAITHEFAELLGVAEIVGGAVIAELVQDQNGVAIHLVQPGIEPVDQDLVQTLTAMAETRIVRFEEIGLLDPIGDMFVARVVIPPFGLDAGMGEDIHQVLRRQGFFVRVVPSIIGGKHAGH